MPLTPKGEEIKSNMEKEYGKGKGESVFYASANKGTIKGVHNDAKEDPNRPGFKGGNQIAYQGPMKPKPEKEDPNRPGFKNGRQTAYEGPMKDQTQPDPVSGPMSTKGPSAGKSEGLPEAATPSSKPASDCAMSLDAIKSEGKRIGRY